MKHSVAALIALLCSHGAAAAEGAPSHTETSPNGFVQAVLKSHPDVRRAEEEVQALRARRTSAGSLFPSQPGVELTGASRTAPGASALNGGVRLSQEFEIAGQREARVSAADAELDAAEQRLEITKRELAITALSAWYSTIAAQQHLELAKRASVGAQLLGSWAEEAAREGLISRVDADVIRSESIQLALDQAAAERELAVALAMVRALIGSESTTDISSDVLDVPALDLPTDGLSSRAIRIRAEIGAVEAERRASEARLSLVRRLRVPNPAVSIFAQRDGFDENVIGVGISIPLPLPLPIWPSRSGEIEEQQARVQQGSAELEATRRRVLQEVATALAADETRQRMLALFDSDLIDRAERELASIADETRAKQLTVREASFAQRSLLSLLTAARQARVDAISARLELIRAAALPIPGVNP